MTPITLEKDREGGYKVTQGNLDSGCLAPDEALGIIAHALFGNGSPHRFLKPQATPPPKLLPCPHCGKTESLELQNGNDGFVRVICSVNNNNGCGCSSGYLRGKDMAIELWNKRAPVSPDNEHQITIKPCELQTLEQLVAEQLPGAWIEWNGGERPLPFGTLVDVKYRSGQIRSGCKAGDDGALRWAHLGNAHLGNGLDIIAYRLHKTEQEQHDDFVSEGGDHD